ncbi:hypothetical protein K450DRAFT_275789 [Umbelopsis ramanniana AG]|uniref:Actin-like protein ARP6 n=1 Tax=Umbelopsis ramanniana AG TaxID=1314678 RepID=A0AAD5E2F1_UMBRA|nr:uncharacterized protein K450DRAFT_275789 [Umbelopsis ramanniana AG]KAI8575246.1 hypothetical protein K450DRAFT_275789 [Umbelopsis ramanniana AG]
MLETLILDNGAYTIKAGIATNPESLCHIPNSIVRGKHDRRNFVGDELNNCQNYSALYYRLPFEKGLLTNWGIEKNVWDRVFSNNVLKVDPTQHNLILSEPCFNLPNMQEMYDQIVYEEYEFAASFRTIAPRLCLYNDIPSLYGQRQGSAPDCVVIVDVGYSFTHIVPFVNGAPVPSAIKRINIGGKLLTNQLKELVSFRYYDMMEETYLINDVKEACCYVSNDVFKDLSICRAPPSKNKIIQEYVLPDFTKRHKGYIIPRAEDGSLQGRRADNTEQILTMNNERFMIPEILFNPSDIGMNQAGIPEAIYQSVQACDPDAQGLLYANVVIVGGNANLPGFKARVQNDLRRFAPAEYDVRVSIPENPADYAWSGAQFLASVDDGARLQNKLVTRKEYLEHGSDICRIKFGSF